MENRKLCYFTTESSHESKGFFELFGAEIHSVSRNIAGHDHAFELRATDSDSGAEHCVLLMAAESGRDMEQWITAIKLAALPPISKMSALDPNLPVPQEVPPPPPPFDSSIIGPPLPRFGQPGGATLDTDRSGVLASDAASAQLMERMSEVRASTCDAAGVMAVDAQVFERNDSSASCRVCRVRVQGTMLTY
jgi:hypothetical protein